MCIRCVDSYVYVYTFQLVDEKEREKKNKSNVKKIWDLQLLVRLTSGLQSNDDDDDDDNAIVAQIHTHFKRLLGWRERKQTLMTKRRKRKDKLFESLFELIEFHGSILEEK